jgi:hypothetical protein
MVQLVDAGVVRVDRLGEQVQRAAGHGCGGRDGADARTTEGVADDIGASSVPATASAATRWWAVTSAPTSSMRADR